MRASLKNKSLEYGRFGIFKKAMNITRKAMKMERDYAEALLQGQAYDNVGMYREAVKAYKQAVLIEPGVSDAYYGLGNAYKKLGKFQEAVAAFQQAVYANPKDANGYFSLGNAYGKIGAFREATIALKRAVQLRPFSSEGHKSLGIYYGRLKMYQEAQQSLRHALKIEPNSAHARFNLALVCLELHDRNGALKEYTILQNISPKTADKLSKRLDRQSNPGSNLL